jgi:hypothetical protein
VSLYYDGNQLNQSTKKACTSYTCYLRAWQLFAIALRGSSYLRRVRIMTDALKKSAKSNARVPQVTRSTIAASRKINAGGATRKVAVLAASTAWQHPQGRERHHAA